MRYEHGGRFWTITRVGPVLTIIAGKVGNKGRTVTKHHATDGAAQSAHDQLVLEKQREGYRIAAASDAPGTPPEEVPQADERGPALEAAITRDPDDAEAFAVYGDWLHKHGDPRGELIALQQASGPKAAAAVGKHLAQHAQRLLGPLAPLVRDVRVADAAPLFWKHGFIRRAELTSVKGKPLDATVAQLLAHPSAKFLVELAVRAYDRREALAILEALAAAPPTLRELDLLARADLGRIAHSVVHALPNLQRLTLAARAFELASDFAVPTLLRARFLATSMTSAATEVIVRAPWPVLERLEIRFCRAGGSTEADFHDVRPLLLRTDMPALTHLKLRGAPFAGAIVRTLLAAPLSRQLEVLDFSAGDFSPLDLQQLALHAHNFPQLRELWLPYNYMTPQIEKQLAAVAKRVLPDSKGPVDFLDADLADEVAFVRYEPIRE